MGSFKLLLSTKSSKICWIFLSLQISSRMFIIKPMKKSKDCDCLFNNDCDGEHPQLRRTLQQTKKNEYLLTALNNTRNIRLINEEKLKRQENNNEKEQPQTEEHKNIRNIYKSMVPNFQNFEIKQDEINCYTRESSEVIQMKKHNKGSLHLLRLLYRPFLKHCTATL